MVLEAKLKRLQTELVGQIAAGKVSSRVSAGEYAETCVSLSSCVNPWFGGSLVPFNITLNCSLDPNVSFEPAGNKVVGRAMQAIQPYEELTQIRQLDC